MIMSVYISTSHTHIPPNRLTLPNLFTRLKYSETSADLAMAEIAMKLPDASIAEVPIALRTPEFGGSTLIGSILIGSILIGSTLVRSALRS
jgi:hypothetical protein